MERSMSQRERPLTAHTLTSARRHFEFSFFTIKTDSGAFCSCVKSHFFLISVSTYEYKQPHLDSKGYFQGLRMSDLQRIEKVALAE